MEVDENLWDHMRLLIAQIVDRCQALEQGLPSPLAHESQDQHQAPEDHSMRPTRSAQGSLRSPRSPPRNPSQYKRREEPISSPKMNRFQDMNARGYDSREMMRLDINDVSNNLYEAPASHAYVDGKVEYLLRQILISQKETTENLIWKLEGMKHNFDKRMDDLSSHLDKVEKNLKTVEDEHEHLKDEERSRNSNYIELGYTIDILEQKLSWRIETLEEKLPKPPTEDDWNEDDRVYQEKDEDYKMEEEIENRLIKEEQENRFCRKRHGNYIDFCGREGQTRKEVYEISHKEVDDISFSTQGEGINTLFQEKENRVSEEDLESSLSAKEDLEVTKVLMLRTLNFEEEEVQDQKLSPVRPSHREEPARVDREEPAHRYREPN